MPENDVCLTIKCSKAYAVCVVMTNYDLLAYCNYSNSVLFRKVKIFHHRIPYLLNSQSIFFCLLSQ